jgi:hypothetical protein
MEKIEKDYEELLKLFNKYKVKYCVVGAFAVAFYAIPRYTKDMDIFIASSKDNANRILNALNEFGFGNLELSANDFSKEGKIIQLGYEPVRIDIITSIEGCTFKQVWKHREKGKYGKENVHFIALDDLIKNKQVSKRKQDKADLEILLIIKKQMSKGRE